VSSATTWGIRVEVESIFVPERSRPDDGYFFFAYRVAITNLGDAPAQLISREWIITDANGQIEVVEGPGVVGEQPRLIPTAGFEYTSFCPLRTSMGTMQGSYTMRRDDGELFKAEIAPFTLAAPYSLN
jgi:ApaG protein